MKIRNVEYENKTLYIDDKIVDGNMIRAMSDEELKTLIREIYNIGYDHGYETGSDDGYNNGYDDGWYDGHADNEDSLT